MNTDRVELWDPAKPDLTSERQRARKVRVQASASERGRSGWNGKKSRNTETSKRLRPQPSSLKLLGIRRGGPQASSCSESAVAGLKPQASSLKPQAFFFPLDAMMPRCLDAFFLTDTAPRRPARRAGPSHQRCRCRRSRRDNLPWAGTAPRRPARRAGP